MYGIRTVSVSNGKKDVGGRAFYKIFSSELTGVSRFGNLPIDNFL